MMVVEPEQAKHVKEVFFLDFAKYHFEWLRQLVAAYKKRGIYPVLPTQIIDYYPDRKDKEIAIFSCLCMSWTNGQELEQIASMRSLMGEHPYEWFRNREFAAISIAREMNNRIDGNQQGQYWKIAKTFDLLYDICCPRGLMLLPSEVLAKKGLKQFCDDVSDICHIGNLDYKRQIMELVLRTKDGIGRNLWPTPYNRVKCPKSPELLEYLQQWWPDYRSWTWTYEDAINFFSLERPYDFFYAYLAHQELARYDSLACRRYLARYESRWETGLIFKRRDWLLKERGRQPDIIFEKPNL